MNGEIAASPASRVIRSRWLGEIEYDPNSELFFPAGLPGFEHEYALLPVEIPAQRPLVYLQSLSHPETCFAALPVFTIDSGFQLHLSEDERCTLDLPGGREPTIGTDVLCLGLLMSCDGEVRTNLNAPVVINLRNARGVQCVPDRENTGHFRLGKTGRWESEC